MKIGIDIMGGDFAPLEAIKGVRLFFEQVADDSVHLLLIGDKDIVAPHLHYIEAYSQRYTLVHTNEEIGMNEHPTKAFKEKPNSTIAIGFGLMHKGESDAFISAGNTGAMMVGAMYTVKNVVGIQRPTIASPIPRVDGKFNLLLDVGLNADCKPENLQQFAELGSLYVKHVYGVEDPKVGLLNVGEEEGKGNLLALATYPLLKNDKSINFIGNVEGRDVFRDRVDVTVCEGFLGNVVLKMAESVYNIFKEDRKIEDELLDNFNYEKYGGSPILGINAPVVIGHGISTDLAFKNMIILSCKMVESNLIGAFQEHFSETES